MAGGKFTSTTKRELILEVWERLDCESVGARELVEIQKALADAFGHGAVESPASIARTVADEGAVLRHPEVLDCDREWRQRNLRKNGLLSDLSFASLPDAVGAFRLIEDERRKFESEGDDGGLKDLEDLVMKARDECMLTSRARVIEPSRRDEAEEIAEWFAVWLRAPKLFSDWLDLRQRSPEFLKKFSKQN